MENIIISIIIIAIIGLCVGYIIKAKKKGVHCIGCPSSGKCSGHCSDKKIYEDICDLKLK